MNNYIFVITILKNKESKICKQLNKQDTICRIML